MATLNSKKNNTDGEESESNEDTLRDGHSSFGQGFDHRALLGREDSKKGFDYRDNSQGSMNYEQPNKINNNSDDNDGNDEGGEQSVDLQFLTPDQRPGNPGDLLAALAEPEIEDDTEAAEALRANAQIKVGKMSKAARSINAQTVRKLVKRASMRGNGVKRGKPPRIPPSHAGAGQQQQQQQQDEDDHQPQTYLIRDEEGNQIYAVQEEDDESNVEEDDDSSASDTSFHEDDEGTEHDPNAVSPLNESKGSVFKGKEDIGNFLTPDLAGEEDEEDIPKEVVAETLDVGRKLMGALDPHNMLQVQRWRRKKRGGKKKRKSYVKGKVIDGRHELYTLSIAVMLGVRTSIARTNTIISSSDGSGKKILSPQDFMAEEKYEFAPKGSPTTPPHKLTHTFKFKDYAPVAFAYLRRMFGVNEFDFLLSVCGNANFIEFISNAKSGQFFFYSSDGKYMIKTMTNTESKFLRRKNPNSLVTKFLGMYRVKLYHLRRNVKFVIMNSVYYTDKSIQTFYDLKGSEIGRAAKPGQDVLKDNDLRNSLPEDAFSFSPNRRARLRTQVESDCNFLRKMQIMDYSMLIGVHHIPPSKVDQRNNIGETGFKIQDRRSHRKQNSKGNVNDVDTDASAKTHRSIGSDPVASLGSTIDNIPKEKQSYQDAAPDSNVNGDSTKRLIKDIRESAYSASNYEFAGLLEDEDDCSYLEGSENHNEQYARKLHAYQQHPKYDDVEMKKEQTIEQIYWPFHKFYDINGYRRMKPKECYSCQKYPCVCEGVSDLVKAWKIPEFIPPLSDRKDGGFMLDTTDTHIPMVYHGEQEDMNYEGKIYFMGIIDILQQYNARKRVETRYRKIEVRGKAEPSCVSPDDYASRFILFFDEYSGKAHTRRNGEEKSNGVEITKNGAHVVSVVSHDKNTTTATNGSVASAKITPDVSTNNDTHKVEGIVGRPVALKPGEKPQGKYVVI